MTAEVQNWLDGLLPERRDDAEWFAAAVRDAIPNVDQAVRWGRLTFTVDGDWHHWLCGIAATKRAVNLTFHKGALLDDPDGLLNGSGRYTRQVSHDAASTHAAELTALLHEAVAHQHDMLDD